MINFQMQKCLHLKDELAKKKPKLSGDFFLRPKIDGWYVYFHYSIVTKTWYPARSSANRQIPAFQWLYEEKVLEKLPKPSEDVILITEAVIPDMLFPEMNGLFNRSVGAFACREVQFFLHDIVPVNRSLPASEREKLLAEFPETFFRKIPIEYFGNYNDKLWTNYFDRFVAEGYEGYIAKAANAVFQPSKRNASLLKKKLETELDLLAVRLEQTTGDRGNLGLTLVSRRKNGIEVRTVINRHSLQDAWLGDSTKILGKIVTVKGMEILEDGQVRQPTFYCIREDKGAEDYE